MASKNIRDVVVKVSGKDIKNAAADSAKLNENLKEVIETVKGSGRSFTSINNALEKLGSSMKTVNSAMSANKVKTKGLETYQARMKELNKTLVTVKNNAQNTAKAMQSVNKSVSMAGATDEMKDLKDGIQKLVEEMRALNFTSKRMKDELVGIEENTGKTSKRLKETREATRGTADAMTDFTKKTGKAKQGADEFNNALRGLNGGGRNGARSFSDLAFSMNPLTSMYAAIAVNVYALTEAFRLLSEAANFERLMNQTANFSAAISGINVKGLARDMSELSQGALSVRESMQFATKGAAFNFTAEQLENLTVGARKASIALGRDFNDSMDRVLRGISKQEIELFDELGVVTRLTPAFEAYANEIGKTVDELSDYERQLALTNEVQKQLDTRFSGIDAQATAWEELGVAAKNSLDNMLITLQAILKPVAQLTTNILQLTSSTDKYRKATDDLTESQKTFNSAIEGGHLGQALVAYSELSKATTEVKESMDDSGKSVEEARERVETLTTSLQVLGGVATAVAARSILTALIPAYASVKTATIAATVATRNATAGLLMLRKVSGVSAVITALAASFKTLAVAMWGNPIILIAGGLALAGIYAFRDEIKALAETLIGLVPGMDNSAQAIGRMGTAAESGDIQLQKFSRSLAEAGISVSSLSEDEIRNMGTALIGFERDLEESGKQLDGFVGRAGKAKGPMSELLNSLTSLRNSNVTESIKGLKTVNDQLAESFKSTAERMQLDTSEISNYDELYSAVDRINIAMRDLGFNTSVAKGRLKLMGATSIDKTATEIQIMEGVLRDLRKVGSVTNAEEIREYEEKLTLLKQQLEYEKRIHELTKLSNQYTRESTVFEARRLGTFTEKSVFMEKELEHESERLAKMHVNNALGNEALYTQEAKVKALQLELSYQERLEKKQKAMREASLSVTQFENSQTARRDSAQLGGRRLSQQTELGAATTGQALALQEAEAKLALKATEGTSDTELKSLKSTVDLEAAKLRIAQIKEEAAAYRDMADAIGNVANTVPGLSSLQSEFLGMSQTMANTMGNVTELMANNQELTLSDFSDSIVAMGTFAANMFSELTQGVVADIDQQIAAEKKRDGKSEESLAKIRQLERKKIKEQEKSKIAQTAMSTSLAIMQTMAEPLPLPAKIAMSAAIGAMGMMQINNIKKASAGQIAGLDEGGAGGLSVSVGSRNNAVDVSQSASMGELSFLRGESGTGNNANSFAPGRAGGGSITVGERGPETITPLQPLYVQPTSQESGSSAPGLSIDVGGLSIHSMDSESFQEAASRNASAFWDAVEAEANARGVSLNSLK